MKKLNLTISFSPFPAKSAASLSHLIPYGVERMSRQSMDSFGHKRLQFEEFSI